MMPRFIQLCFILCLLIYPQVHAAVVFGVVPEKQAGAGVVVARVAENTPAHAAGLQAGDVLLSVQGETVTDAASLRQVLSSYSAGAVVRVQYLREGALAVALVELADRPEPGASQSYTEEVEMSTEVQVQFMQAKSRLRIQLRHLPYRMDADQVQADMQELLTLARSVPGKHPGWLQGSSVETSLSFADAAGYVMLKSENGEMYLELSDKTGTRLFSAPIATRQQREALPLYVRQRLQKL